MIHTHTHTHTTRTRTRTRTRTHTHTDTHTHRQAQTSEVRRTRRFASLEAMATTDEPVLYRTTEPSTWYDLGNGTVQPAPTIGPPLPPTVHTPVTILVAVVLLIVTATLLFQIARVWYYNYRKLTVRCVCVCVCVCVCAITGCERSNIQHVRTHTHTHTPRARRVFCHHARVFVACALALLCGSPHAHVLTCSNIRPHFCFTTTTADTTHTLSHVCFSSSTSRSPSLWHGLSCAMCLC